MVGPKLTSFSNIQQSFNFDFLEENVFAFLTRFLCPGLRAHLYVCGMVRVPSVEVTDLVATFCFFKP